MRKWLPGASGALRRIAQLKETQLTLSRTSLARGDATADTVQLCSLGAVKVVLSEDRYSRSRLTRRIEAARTDIAPLQTPPREAKSAVWKVLEDAMVDTEGEWEIYVDGSWMVRDSPAKAVFFEGSKLIQAGAAMVIIRKNHSWKRSRVTLVHLSEGEALKPGSAFPMELLALVLDQLT